MTTRLVPLTSANIVLLRRALKFYAKEYDLLSKSGKNPDWTKEYDAQYARAADRLCHELLHGKVDSPDKFPDVSAFVSGYNARQANLPLPEALTEYTQSFRKPPKKARPTKKQPLHQPNHTTTTE